MTLKNLLLFDIHGTLLDSPNFLADYESQLTNLASEYFGKKINICFDGYHGLTERYNLKDVFAKQGLKISEQKLDNFLNFSGNRYKIKEGSINLIPHVLKALESLREKYLLGLVTGSQKLVALKCLKSAGIKKYFSFGAFGDESYDRSELVKTAIKNSDRKFNKENIYVIGDTIHDIEAGKNAGVKTIAVLTGSGTREQLELINPDNIINNLSELEKILDQLIHI